MASDKKGLNDPQTKPQYETPLVLPLDRPLGTQGQGGACKPGFVGGGVCESGGTPVGTCKTGGAR